VVCGHPNIGAESGEIVSVVWSQQEDLPPLEGAEIQAIQDVVQAVLVAQGRADAEVSVHIGDDALLQTLNRTYRGIDRPTDVLSFGSEDPPGGLVVARLPDLLGDVVISLDRASEQAQQYGHPRRRELSFLAAHGTLHLLGFDHDTPEAEAVMTARAEAVLAALGIYR